MLISCGTFLIQSVHFSYKVASVAESISKFACAANIFANPFVCEQIPALLTDLEWWAEATRNHRETHGLPKY